MKCVNLNHICAYLGVRIFSYEAGAETIRKLHLEQVARENPWVCCLYREVPIIFFDGTRSTWAIRFFVATALGIFALGCLNGQEAGRLTRRERLKVNLFAVRLLLRIAKINRHFHAGTVWGDWCGASCTGWFHGDMDKPVERHKSKWQDAFEAIKKDIEQCKKGAEE